MTIIFIANPNELLYTILKTKAHFMVIYVHPKYPRNLGILRKRDRLVPRLLIPAFPRGCYQTALATRLLSDLKNSKPAVTD
jgi:hypothetical protein